MSGAAPPRARRCWLNRCLPRPSPLRPRGVYFKALRHTSFLVQIVRQARAQLVHTFLLGPATSARALTCTLRSCVRRLRMRGPRVLRAARAVRRNRYPSGFKLGSQRASYPKGHSTRVLNGLTRSPTSIGWCRSSRSCDWSVGGTRLRGIARRYRFNTPSIYEIQVISRKESNPLRV